MLITSSANEKIKELKKLMRSASARIEKNCFVVEGIRMFREIEADRLLELYVSESAMERYDELKKLKNQDIKLTILSDRLYESVSDTGSPQGILALVKRIDYSLTDIVKEQAFIYILEKLQDPGNVGTIIRTAEAAGATGIVISDDSVDIYNPKVVRSTMGALFRMPIIVSHNLQEDIYRLKDRGVEIYGAHLSGRNIYESSFKKKCGFLIGNEGNGLSDEVSHTADKLIRIPMKGKVESLNAAASATVIGYEVLRQREYSNFRQK